MDTLTVQLLAEVSSTETRARKKTPSGPQMPKGHQCTADLTGVITDLSFTDEKGDPGQPLPNTAPMQSSPLQCVLKLFVNPLDSYINGLIYLEIKI